MKILVTGFEPFGGDTINPSWLVAQELERVFGAKAELAAQHGAGSAIEVVAKRLPVEFGACGEQVSSLMDVLRPDAVLCLGQARGRSQLTPEFVGINWRCARIADNAGVQPTGEKILHSGPDAYFATLPVQAMVDAACTAEVPAALSYTAGTYCCNETLYAALHKAATNMPQTRCGFVHIPPLPSQVVCSAQTVKDEPSMAFDLIVKGLEAMIYVLNKTA